MINLNEASKLNKKNMLNLVSVMNDRILELEKLFDIATTNPGLFEKEIK